MNINGKQTDVYDINPVNYSVLGLVCDFGLGFLHLRWSGTDDSGDKAVGTMILLWEEGVSVTENWLLNWKTGINLCISHKWKLTNQL